MVERPSLCQKFKASLFSHVMTPLNIVHDVMVRFILFFTQDLHANQLTHSSFFPLTQLAVIILEGS